MTERALPDWIDSYLTYTDNSEPADSFRLWTAISCIASSLKRKCWLDLGSLTFYPNLYIVLVGPAASRKGTAMGPGFRFLQNMGIRMAAEATTREALIKALRTASDTTINIETGAMIMHSSLTIFSQELTVFLGYNNMQLISDLTDWYDCRGKWIYQTKNMGTDDITGVWVNLFGATTPSLLQTTLPCDAIGGGLTSRIIFIYESGPGKIVALPFLNEEQEALIPQLEHDLEMIHMLSGQFRFDIGFLDAYSSWYLKQTATKLWEDERLAGYLGRRANHILKLCMVMSASRSNEMCISAVDLRRAILILTEAERNMPRVFAGIGRSAIASVTSRILAAVEEHGEISKDEIIRRFLHDADSWSIGKVMDTLSDGRLVVPHIRGRDTIFVSTNRKD
jgi:hypothetical protein